MIEKVLLESNNDYAKKLKKTTTMCVAISAIIFVVLAELFTNVDTYNDPYKENSIAILGVLIICFFVVSLCLMIFAMAIQKTKITVSDKRVYGVTTFGKRVDLPLDSISSVGISMFNGIAIGTSSGRIVFKGIGNRDEIHDAISKLLVDRQNKEKVASATTIKQEIPQSNADELKKYKELLDSGVITQEEFDAKKKQLLGL